ncbi:MAG: hypothetical protein MAG795_00105 [Candidatus Woesearchaeota archaeon]|nr:hypothetical protein [Candidatus Woesearchaeota archaeon]
MCGLKFKKHHLFLVLKVILLVSVFVMIPYFKWGTVFSKKVWQDRSTACLRFLQEGRLYQRVPSCGQGPVYYLIGYAASSLVGNNFMAAYFEHRMDIFFTVVNILLNLLLVLLIMQHTKRHTGKDYFLLVLLLYVPLVYFYSILKFEMFMAAFFIFCGYFMSQKSGISQKFAPILYSLALLTKITSLYAVGVLIFIRLFSYKKPKIKQNIEYIVVPIVLIILFQLITPNFYFYMLVPMLMKNPLSPKNQVMAILSNLVSNYIFITLTIMFLLSLFLFLVLKKYRTTALLPMLGIPLVVFLALTNNFNPIDAFVRYDFHLT